MKKPIILLLLLLAGNYLMHAQLTYNKSYSSTYSSVPIPEQCQKILATNDLGYPIAMLVMDPTNNNNINLKIFDNLGNLGSSYHWSVSFPSGSTIWPTDMILTPDNDFIIVGYHKRGDALPTNYSGVFVNPFAIRVKPDGSLVWKKEYKVNMDRSFPYYGCRKPKVSIARVDDEPGEDNYIIVSAGEVSTPTDGSTSYDVCIDALKIDGNTGVKGTSGWHYKYQYPAAAAFPSPLPVPPGRSDRVVESMPLSIAYGDGLCLITGEQDGANTFNLTYNSFYMAIDKHGIPQTITLPSAPPLATTGNYVVMRNYAAYDPNVIFDNHTFGTNQFVIAYSLPNGGKWLPEPLGSAGIGILKLNSSTIDQISDYVYYPPGLQASQRGITTNFDEDKYILSTQTRTLEGMGNTANLSMLSVDKMLETPLNWTRYNVNRTVWTSHSIARILEYGWETYSIAGSVDNGSALPDLRLINDFEPALSDVCGLDPVPSTRTNILERPLIYTYIHNLEPLNASEIILDADEVQSTSTDCEDYFPHDDYRTAAGINPEPSVKLYPTLLQKGTQDLSIELTTASECKLNAVLTSIDGRIINTQHYEVANGSQTISWQIPALAPGNYTVLIQSEDNKLTGRYRLAQL